MTFSAINCIIKLGNFKKPKIGNKFSSVKRSGNPCRLAGFSVSEGSVLDRKVETDEVRLWGLCNSHYLVDFAILAF